jgi:hypothetical protein
MLRRKPINEQGGLLRRDTAIHNDSQMMHERSHVILRRHPNEQNRSSSVLPARKVIAQSVTHPATCHTASFTGA